MLSFEERWATVLLQSFAPASGPGLAPSEGEVRYVAAFREMIRASTPAAALGIRVALWLVFLAPLWMGERVGTLRSLQRERRAPLLARLLDHRLHIVRELTLLLKLAACMAIFRLPSMRAASHYDDTTKWEPEDVERSGERARVRLAVVAQDEVEVA